MANSNKDLSTFEPDVKQLVALQVNRFETLKQTFTNFKKDSAQRKTKVYFEQRLSKLTQLENGFHQTHEEIIMANTDANEPYLTNKLQVTFEEYLLDVVCHIMDARDQMYPEPQQTQLTSGASSEPQLIVNSIKLPKLPVPSFSGKFTEWPSFYDAFVRLIHNNNELSNIQKFYFLKEALPASSDVDVRQMDLTDVNYKLAWDIIVQRYNNPRLQYMHHMNALYALPVLQRERADEIKSMLNVAKVCINEFDRLKIPISSCDHWIAHHITTRLPNETLRAFEHHLGAQTDIPTFETIETFLSNRLVGINVIENRSTHHNHQNGIQNLSTSKSKDSRKPHRKQTYTATTNSNKPMNCAHCKENHILRRCPIYLAKDCLERKTIVDQTKVCTNCLSPAHQLDKCSSSKNCNRCGQRHHTSLHEANILPSPSATTSNSSNIVSTFASTISRRVLLATANVTIQNPITNQQAIIRALIDPGSEATLISENAVQLIGLKRQKTSANICGIGGKSNQHCKFIVSCMLLSQYNLDFRFLVDTIYVLPQLTSLLPSKFVQPQTWPHIEGLQLADPLYFRPHKIDLVIGADLLPNILLPDLRTGATNQPMAQKTQFGWILSGPVSQHVADTVTINSNHAKIDLECLVKKLYELDHVSERRKLSAEEQWCEDHFKTTHCRQPTGKYLVRLPLKSLFDDTATLGRSKQIALNRFYALERKLNRDNLLRQNYIECINEYFRLHQIEPASTTEDQHCTRNKLNRPTVTSCVLPHHAVIKEDSLTTKLRIVFDASCKTTNDRSLNSLLCIGPPLQTDLAAVITNWRCHKYVFTTDIQRMYRCIDMHPDDSQYQRILWRNTDGSIQEFCLTTVTFGTASAPFTAIRILHQLADDECSRYPLAKNVLTKEVYVDDILTGHHTLDGAVHIRNDVRGALSSAGMELRKWASNCPSLVADLPNEHISYKGLSEFNCIESVKTLGLAWHPTQDIFKFKLNFKLSFQTITKRTVLSTVARLFDPLGFVAPVIITAKIILKDVWNYKIDRQIEPSSPLTWDEELPNVLKNRWIQFLRELSTIDNVIVPRWFQYHPDLLTSAQLHAFCDGSKQAYAATVYLRIKHINGSITTHLIIAKCRLNPNQPITIPRVELCGAVLAADLVKWTKTHINLPNLETYFWTDATIILHWLKGDYSLLKTFVANRVGRILDVSSDTQWNHVSTTDNPADHATRGLTPNELRHTENWWKGPHWLSLDENHWPQASSEQLKIDPEIDEEKSVKLIACFSLPSNAIMYEYSSLRKLEWAYAHMLRFVNNIRAKQQKTPKQSGPITVQEYKLSLLKLIELVQRDKFSDEIYRIKKNLPLPHKNKISSLTPFLDTNGILRVKGRLKHASLPYSQQHPIILPAHHHLTDLIIRDAHQTTLHGGIQLTIATLRRRYWILNIKRSVPSILRDCVTCFRANPIPNTQLMGDLPYHRVNPPHRPFLATGIDYAGPIELKSSKFRGNTVYKGYIAIFLCLATKAIHIEAVTGLSTEHFLLALQRFMNRRGLCSDIYSDCGTNFLGADNALRNMRRKFINEIQDKIVPELTARSIQWHFNPPHSPNFGGVWEANVKSIKYHLKRTIGGNRLTYEDLSTVLTRIEACLNSRPLCAMTSNPDDLSVLTPAHFLIGDTINALPEPTESFSSVNQLYNQIQKMSQQFWKLWSSDWLSHLQSRPKWRTAQPNLQLNDIVIIRDDRFPPNEWALGRIMELHPGCDNLVRVATVKTQNGTYKRSISKLCRLPIPNFSSEINSN